MYKFKRSVPYFRSLIKSSKRMQFLKECPRFVIDDICEILYNVLKGNVTVSQKFGQVVQKHNKKMGDFIGLKKHSARKTFLRKQHGGFLGALIPLIAGVIGASI